MGDDSEDSDGEGGLGNVNRLIMRPPGHSGKAKRGHLCFDASFETGNLGRVDLVNEYEYDLFIRPDTCNPQFRFWFNFTVDNVKLDQRVIFNIVNISKYRNAFKDNLTPVVKSSTRPKWQRIPKKYVFYQRSVAHQGHYVLSFVFGFDKEDEIFQFALAPPYSYSRLQSYLSALETKASHLNDCFTKELLGNSIQKRRIDLITIGKPKEMNYREKKRVIVIMVRIHPGDSPASFVCQGLLELLLSSNSIASVLQQYVIFKIVPMLNPDGVFLGNYRSTFMGSDLNRSYHIASPWNHPSLRAAIDMLLALDKNKEFQLDFVLDIHAHSSLNGCFIYGNTYEDVYRYERHIVFPKLLATIADDYNSSNTMFNSDNDKIGTARRYLCSILSNKVNCYTFEVSCFGYQISGTETIIPYTEDSYKRCGRNLIKSFLDYYQVTGIIPITLTSELSQKKKKAKTQRVSPISKFSARNTPKTARQPILLHFTNLEVNYDADVSGDELQHTGREKKECCLRRTAGDTTFRSRLRSPLPPTLVVIPKPTLSIIDFNQITRNEIEAARKTYYKNN